jgi:protein-S-isoprenylcysteine O-methyltransferase Ste14
MIQAAIFILASAGITWLSRRSLFTPQAHGFFRFFAFEAILALVVLQLEHWFANPLAYYQVISWILLVVCILPVVLGYTLLHSVGKPQGSFENTTRLVQVGVYRFIRHPMYSSLLLLAWGAFFKLPTLAGAGLALGASAFLLATAKVEEGENLRHFGDEYAQYMKTTRRFIPFVF